MEKPIEELTLEELEQELKDAEGRLPAHSVRPWQIAEIEQLEDEIARRRKESEGSQNRQR